MRQAALAHLAVAVLCAAPLLFAQGAPGQGSAAVYRVEFFLSTQTAGTANTSRTYSLRLSAGNNHVVVDTGSKIPISSGIGGGFSYQNVGVRLDCMLLRAESSEALGMRVNLGISAVASGDGAKAPIISTVSAALNTSVPLGRKLTVAEFENPQTHTHYELAVEAEAAPRG